MHFGLEQGFGVSSNTKFGSLFYLFWKFLFSMKTAICSKSETLI